MQAIIGNYADMAILLGIQFANASISFYETTKAGDAVAALKASLKPKATVKRDGTWSEMDATMIVPGDLVLLAAGSAAGLACAAQSQSQWWLSAPSARLVGLSPDRSQGSAQLSSASQPEAEADRQQGQHQGHQAEAGQSPAGD